MGGRFDLPYLLKEKQKMAIHKTGVIGSGLMGGALH